MPPYFWSGASSKPVTQRDAVAEITRCDIDSPFEMPCPVLDWETQVLERKPALERFV